MSTDERIGAEGRDRSTRTAVARWFDAYALAFTELTRAQRDDYDVLLDHYADPALIATDDLCVSASAGRVVGMMRQQIEALRKSEYDRTTADRFEIRPVSENAALIDARWSRQTSDGAARAHRRPLHGRQTAGWLADQFHPRH